MYARTPTALVAAALLVTGCGRIGSEKISTDSIFADITVFVDPGQGTTTASAVLSDSADALELAGNDILFARADGIELVMGPEPTDDDEAVRPYEATFDFAAEDVELTVAFERKVDAGAPSTTFSTPPAFSIIEIEEAVPRDSGFDLEWQPATTDGMRIEISGDCLAEDYVFEVEDPAAGKYTVPGDTLITGSGSADVCVVDVDFIRYRAGSLDPGYADGSAFAEAWRSTKVETKAGDGEG